MIGLLCMMASLPPACSTASAYGDLLADVRKRAAAEERPARGLLVAFGRLAAGRERLQELARLKGEGRARLQAYAASLDPACELASLVDKNGFVRVDAEIAAITKLLEGFTAERVAKAARLLDRRKRAELGDVDLDDWHALFAGDAKLGDTFERIVDDDYLARPFSPRLTWFGTSVDDPRPCDERGGAVAMLFDAVGTNRGWDHLAEGLDLESLARLSRRVHTAAETSIKIHCLNFWSRPELRYDGAARRVEAEVLVRGPCFGPGFRLNLPDAGSSPGRRFLSVPDEEWARLRESLLAP